MDHDSSGISAEAFTSIHSRLSQLTKSQTQQQRCIYKVHQHLRSINDKAYEPQVIAIGPYHRGKDKLQMMEEHKLRYFESVLLRKGQSVKQYISAIGELEELARSCYSEPISLNAPEFIDMLVLDGCFIIEFLKKFNRHDRKDPSCKNDPIFQIYWTANCLRRDFILFENQIPFFVLCELFYLMEEAPNQDNRFNDVARFFCLSLDLRLVQGNRSIRDSADERKHLDETRNPGDQIIYVGEIKHLLDLMHESWRPDSCIRALCFLKKTSTSARECGFNNIPSATELTKANVSFSKGKPDDGLFRVDFKKGVLVMPQLTVGDNTECIFRNLIAYEQYFPDERGNFVMDYVLFMDRLINTPRDVEILSKSKIIDNWMGDNEAVVGIFNRLNVSVTVRSTLFMYSGVVDRITKHYERPWNHAMARLRRDYFNSPWALIAFFSAVFLLLLTGAQTVCSLLQVV